MTAFSSILKSLDASDFEDYSSLVSAAQSSVALHSQADMVAVPLVGSMKIGSVEIVGNFGENCVAYIHKNAVAAANITITSQRPKFPPNNVKIAVGDLTGTVKLSVTGENVVALFGDCGPPFSLTARTGVDSQLTIGDATTMGSVSVMVARSSLAVGKDCMFSVGISLISAVDHGVVEISDGKAQVPSQRPELVIGDHAWLGYNSHCVGGACIGDGAILAAHSVLADTLPANSTGAGNPMKVVGSNRTWSRFADRADENTKNYLSGNQIEIID